MSETNEKERKIMSIQLKTTIMKFLDGTKSEAMMSYVYSEQYHTSVKICKYRVTFVFNRVTSLISHVCRIKFNL